MRILSVVGARPNFVKTAPVVSAIRRLRPDWEHVLVHTGQHYDRAMSELFLEELGMPTPEHELGVGSGTASQQTAWTMERLAPVLEEVGPDVVIVPGDVNSTLGAAVAAVQGGVRLAHLEAGLRSHDRTMPEELNRVLTDSVADLLFVHSEDAVANLQAEGVAPDAVHLVGNTMIDTLVALDPVFRERRATVRLGLEPGERFLLVTLHRPALVDGPLLQRAVAGLERVAAELPVVFPVHPRTAARMSAGAVDRIKVVESLGYIDFLSLLSDAAGVLTDSGGVQEESTYLGVPCFTLRAVTERPVTVTHGTNTVIGLDPERIAEIPTLLASPRAGDGPPPLWDGRAAERIVAVLADA